jgi:hypothetical protein
MGNADARSKGDLNRFFTLTSPRSYTVVPAVEPASLFLTYTTIRGDHPKPGFQTRVSNQASYGILSHMTSGSVFRESRRSTRVSIKVSIEVEAAEHFTCEGETIVVNLHGALISTPRAMNIGMRITVRVYLTDKHAKARVVYVDLARPLQCGIELDQPHNIWGVPLPPKDWDETEGLNVRH